MAGAGGGSLAAYEFNKLANAGARPATPQTAVSIDRKARELQGSLNLNEWGSEDGEVPPSSAEAARRFISTDRKQDELRGNAKVLTTDVAYKDAFVSHAQGLEPHRHFDVEAPPHWAEGRIVHVKETRPASPINGSPGPIFRKGTGDRSSHIDCLPLTNSPPPSRKEQRDRLPEVRGSSPSLPRHTSG